MTPPEPSGPPGKFEITRAELVWPGKYDAEGRRRETPRIDLPFQVIERVNESRADRERRTGSQKTLFDYYEGEEGDTFEDGWRNKLIWGDNLLVMASLLDKFAGKIDLIYIDPPFATGSNFSFPVEIGDQGDQLEKSPSAIEEKAYNDTWGAGMSSWIRMIHPRLVIMRDLLRADGSILVHMDQHVNSYMRILLDDVFGRDHFRNEIIWCYPPKGKGPKFGFHQKHDVIYYYGRSKDLGVFQRPYTPLDAQQRAKFSFVDSDGRRFKDIKGRRVYLDEIQGRPVPSWWDDIGQTGQSRIEFLGYPTQKPVALMRRIITACSTSGGLVADFFSGSGTSMIAAELSGRRWIGCDIGRWGVHVTRKRLLDTRDCQPFEVLNLGKYERQYWQTTAFGESDTTPRTEQAIYEYFAFILRLYGARPLPGVAQVHGKKGEALVHIGAVDAPVTISEITGAVDECVALRQRELHVLGWEWEMGLAGPDGAAGGGGLMHRHARQKGVRLRLLRIPHEVMEERAAALGDVAFHELAYLDAGVDTGDDGRVRVTLRNFVIPNPDSVPEEVRDKIAGWSDWVDYWAVDWSFLDDTFTPGWMAYRTRKERSLPTVSDGHRYEKPGRYRVLVKVIDIFGNDTSQVLDIEIP